VRFRFGDNPVGPWFGVTVALVIIAWLAIIWLVAQV
jgi:hypothetical protein